MDTGNNRLRRKTKHVLDALEGRFGAEERPPRDPLEVLVRGVLSQNTSDANSGSAFEALREHYDGWDGIRCAPRTELEQIIRCGGLAGRKAATIQTALSRLHERGGYDLAFLDALPVAEAERELTAIKGIGVKTARLVLLFGFGKAAFVVDTHVLRVVKRLGLVESSCSRIRAHEVMSTLIPPERTYSAHMNMIKLGRRICRPRNPQCGNCPVRAYCLHWQSL